MLFTGFSFFAHLAMFILLDEILYHVHRIAASAAAMVSMTGMVAVYMGKLLLIAEWHLHIRNSLLTLLYFLKISAGQGRIGHVNII